MKSKERTHAVGAAIRKSIVPAIEAAKSPMSPPSRNPTDKPISPMTVGNMSPSAPPRTGETV
jgi:hypothetical protein